MAGVCKNVLEAVGNTPLIELCKMQRDTGARVLAKFEAVNPGGSIKTRTALGMVEAAERDGRLRPGSIIVEATSGNQGIGLAMVAAAKGYRAIICMPDNMSEERKSLIRAYGAELRLVPAGRDIQEAIASARRAAEEIAADDPRVFLAGQFSNPANPWIHRTTTAREILEQVDGPITAFVAGVGTGGSLTGIGEAIKERFPDAYVAAVEPEKAAILSGSRVMEHHVQQGIGDGLIPEVLNTAIYDDVIVVSDCDAVETAKRLAREEGLFVGVSSGSNVWAALRVAAKLGNGKIVVTILPDTGERYLSCGLF
ncbi:MAG: cysteine synthase A [Firmicutes bacterium]|nr:cysteine synthase A [Bacillota bacterium]